MVAMEDMEGKSAVATHPLQQLIRQPVMIIQFHNNGNAISTGFFFFIRFICNEFIFVIPTSIKKPPWAYWPASILEFGRRLRC
jgi:hypothetical protein